MNGEKSNMCCFAHNESDEAHREEMIKEDIATKWKALRNLQEGKVLSDSSENEKEEIYDVDDVNYFTVNLKGGHR